jgi:integrase
MSVRIRNGRFVIDYYPEGRTGRRVRLALPESVVNMKMARAIEQELRGGSKNSELRPDNNSAVNELFPIYLMDCKDRISPATIDNMEWTFRRKIGPFLGHFRLRELDRSHTILYRRLRKEDGVKNRTVNKELAYFMMFVAWCRSEHPDIAIKDFRHDRLPEEKPKHIVLSPHEAIRFIQAAERYYKVFFLCIYSLALRFSEATGLTWNDIDRENKLIKVRGKGGKERLLPVSDWLLYALDNIRPDPATGLVFRSRRTGGPIVNVQKAIVRACRSAGITKHVHPHLLRHSLATHFMGWHINIKVIQEWLGHSREDTTADIYTHAEVDHLRDAQNFLNDGFNVHLKKEDFQKEKPAKQKRAYTMSPGALEARRKGAHAARAAKASKVVTIGNKGSRSNR